MTHDADLVVELQPHHAAGLSQKLSQDFYAPDFVIEDAIERGDHFNAIHSDTSFKIDFWIRKQNLYEEVCFSRRQLRTMFGRQVWLTSAEDIILSKLLWYKMSPVQDRQIQDVLEVYEIQMKDLDMAYLNEWATELEINDLLERILKLAEDEDR